MRKKITKYILNQYGVEPDFPWEGDDTSAVFRHPTNRKWFALIMDLYYSTLGLESDDPVSAINLKIDDSILHETLVNEPGIMPAYHMNKRHWVTVLLDGSVPEKNVYELIDISFNATAPKRRRKV